VKPSTKYIACGLSAGIHHRGPARGASAAGTEPWITTWVATPAPRWAEELPAPFNVPEVLEGQAVRQVARISDGGDQMRIVLSNEFGAPQVTIGPATVAFSAGGDTVDPATVKPAGKLRRHTALGAADERSGRSGG
jgi:hypothetical protein